jgi:hypothetical protein
MFEQPVGKVEKDRSRLIIVISGLAVLGVIALIIFASSYSPKEKKAPDMAQAGSPEFDTYAPNVKIENFEKYEGERLNVHYARMTCKVVNAGDKTITGLQLRGVIFRYLDETLKEEFIKDKVVTIIPGQFEKLSPNQSLPVELFMEPIPDPNTIAYMQMKIEVYGLKTK